MGVLIRRGLRPWTLAWAALALIASGPASSASAATPQGLADQLATNDAALRQAIDTWRTPTDPPTTLAPIEVSGPATLLQTIVRKLSAHPNLARVTVPLLSGSLRS